MSQDSPIICCVDTLIKTKSIFSNATVGSVNMYQCFRQLYLTLIFSLQRSYNPFCFEKLAHISRKSRFPLRFVEIRPVCERNRQNVSTAIVASSMMNPQVIRPTTRDPAFPEPD